MIDPKVNLETDSFFLIQIKESHFKEIYAVANNPVIWKQHPEKNRWKEEVFLIFFQNAMQNELGCFGIFDKDSNKFIGSTRFYSSSKEGNSVRIGYTFLSPEYWGTFANVEIKKVMLNYAFQFVDKVFFDVAEKNKRSRKAIEKLGAILSDKRKDKVTYQIDKNQYMHEIKLYKTPKMDY
ncbi:GNAT family N-acetyltransferase [Gammaproteobacteria bacterium]|nr:GNAT family N-acetyltransferase [Gammaproteobacteria bacterium]